MIETRLDFLKIGLVYTRATPSPFVRPSGWVPHNAAVCRSQRGSIDVDGATVSFLGNLGSSPVAPEPGVARNVLLLHGAKYSAQTWQNLGTLAVLADAGFRVAAVDLPTSVM